MSDAKKWKSTFCSNECLLWLAGTATPAHTLATNHPVCSVSKYTVLAYMANLNCNTHWDFSPPSIFIPFGNNDIKSNKPYGTDVKSVILLSPTLDFFFSRSVSHFVVHPSFPLFSLPQFYSLNLSKANHWKCSLVETLSLKMLVVLS